MKQIYRFFLLIILFYLALFGLARLVFLLTNFNRDTPFSFLEALPAFIHGMRMDLSVISYLIIPLIVLSGIYLLKPFNWLNRIGYFYQLFILAVLFFILPANILLYKYWGSLLSFRSLSYLRDIAEISASFTGRQIATGVALMSVFLFFLFFSFHRYFLVKWENVNESVWKKAAGFLGMIFLSVVFLRGGFQKLPMNESLVSYSGNNFLNQTAVNPVWHLANDVYRAGIFEGNPFAIMPEEEAEAVVKELYAAAPDSFPQILNSKNPNIVFLILESFTADIVEALGGEKDVTPVLNSLIRDGVFFNSIYASGTRTDQGIVSLLNGWPATPYYSIMRSTEKSNQLPSIPKLFLERGYTTSFLYGGESNFSNMNVYCINQKFRFIYEEKNFPDSISSGGWGIPDEFVFRKQLDVLNKTKEPFLSVLMTLSSHEPFDVPGPARFPGNSDSDKFRNAAAYTDAKLGEYFSVAREAPWFKNTLFIIVADHGHHLPRNTNVYYPESHRIPMLFYGDVIKSEFKGAEVHKLGGHHDLAGTLLPQMGIGEYTQFEWSKNLLNPTVKNFAYFQIDQLVAWIDPQYWYGYSYNRKKFIARSYNVPAAHLETMQKDGQAFVQVLYDRYRKY